MNTTTRPIINEVQKAKWPVFKKTQFKNGVPLTLIYGKRVELVEIKLVFNCGRYTESKKMAASYFSSLWMEGTTTKTSKEISEVIDFLGARMRIGGGMDRLTISMLGQPKHLKTLFSLLGDIIYNPTFPRKEFDNYKRRSIQRLNVLLENNKVVADRELTALIFGKDHPYGYNSTQLMHEDFQYIDLIKFYNSQINTDTCSVYMAGKYTDEIIDDFENKIISPLGKLKLEIEHGHNFGNYVPQRLEIKLKDSNQVAIRMGFRLFAQSHQDYFDFFISDYLLGGYFGSRLTSSIREEKGYTYSIYSNVRTFKHGGYFEIGTTVNPKYTEQTIDAIFEEIELLKKEKVHQKELNKVKNSIKALFLQLVDGPFMKNRLISNLLSLGLDKNYFESFLNRVDSIQPDDIQKIFLKYFEKTNFILVIAGKIQNIK